MGRVGSQNYLSWIDRVGSGPMSKISNKYAICIQEICRLSTIIPNDKKL